MVLAFGVLLRGVKLDSTDQALRSRVPHSASLGFRDQFYGSRFRVINGESATLRLKNPTRLSSTPSARIPQKICTTGLKCLTPSKSLVK